MLAECPVNMLKMKEKFSIVYLKSEQLAVHIDAYGRRTGLSRSSITKHLKQVQQVVWRKLPNRTKAQTTLLAKNMR